ncbi:MAG: PKD domain-containing protein [Thermoplasmatota archaeon]
MVLLSLCPIYLLIDGIDVSANQDQAADLIVCGEGTAPVLDGMISPEEWSDARQVTLLSSSGGEMVLRFKHDGSELFLCIGTGGDYMAEVYLDVDNQGGYRPKPDDCLLHISSALFEQQGEGLRWGDPNYDVEGWESNTMAAGDGVLECSVTSAKMGSVIEASGSLGIGFIAVDVAFGDNVNYVWPDGGGSDNPNTWGDIRFSSKDDEQHNIPPEASAVADIAEGHAPLEVAFEGTGIDDDGTVTSYHWDFDDGETSTDQNPVHIFDFPDTYLVILTVSDDEGASGTDEITITVRAVQDGDSGQVEPGDDDVQPENEFPGVNNDKDQDMMPLVIAFFILAAVVIILLITFRNKIILSPLHRIFVNKRVK